MLAPPLLAALVRGGLTGEAPDEWSEAQAGLTWLVAQVIEVKKILRAGLLKDAP